MPTEGQSFAPASDSSVDWQRGFVLVAFVGLGILAFSLRPARVCYDIENGRLSVSAVAAGVTPPSYERTIALDRIEEATLVCLPGGTLIEGTFAPDLCAGYFDYPGLGRAWQATLCQSDVVLLRVRGEDTPVILAPPDRAVFVEAVRSGTPGGFSPTWTGRFPSWRGRLLTLTLVVLPFLFLALVASSRLRYRVVGHALEVRTLLRRIRFSLRGTRARRYRPERSRRLFGTRFPAYMTGRFQLDGTSTRVYASSKNGVLIENGVRLFVSPADTNGFLAALAAAGVNVEP